MNENCLMCGKELRLDNIKDIISYCHACYLQKNPQIYKYLAKVKEMGKA